MTVGLNELLREARSGLRRLTPPEAAAAQRAGALIVDLRAESHLRAEGSIPGAIAVERNVLEWRLDPAGAHRLAELEGPDQTVVLVCDEGYASSLAAATLQRIGLRNATDLIGGFRAWKAVGCPVGEVGPHAPA